MEAYKIGVSILLTNSLTPGLLAMTSQVLGLNNAVSLVNGNLGRLRLAATGAAGILGGAVIFTGMAKLAAHGAEVNHQLELMKIAGMSNSDIQASMGQSMKTTGAVMTTTLSENLAHIRELRYAFGDTEKAMAHLDMVSKANSVLNSIKGGGHDQVWELVKALENKGLTSDAGAFESYINTMTKVTEATGGKVTPANFMSTFKYGRTAMLGWDESFIGGALPRSIQSMTTGGGGSGGGGGPGNALMSAFAKVVQGQMPKNAAEEFDRMGLAPGGAQHIKGSSDSQVAGGIAGRDQFIANPYEWVQKTLMPALASKGITSQNDIIAQISKMFPVRTASQVIGEYALQGRFRDGENSPFEKDIGQTKGAMDLSKSFPELMSNDYPTVLKAFHQQFKTLLEVLGTPLIAPGGPVLKSMQGITSALSAMSQFASANPEGVKVAMSIFAGGAVMLMVGGIVALGAAIAPLVGMGGAIVAAAAGMAALVAMNWDGLKDFGTRFLETLKGQADAAIAGMPAIFSGIGAAILSAIKGSLTGIGGSLGITPGGSTTSPGKTGSPAAQKTGYLAVPPPTGGGTQHASVIMDHRVVGRIVTAQMVKQASGPTQGAAWSDSSRAYPSNDTYSLTA